MTPRADASTRDGTRTRLSNAGRGLPRLAAAGPVLVLFLLGIVMIGSAVLEERASVAVAHGHELSHAYQKLDASIARESAAEAKYLLEPSTERLSVFRAAHEEVAARLERVSLAESEEDLGKLAEIAALHRARQALVHPSDVGERADDEDRELVAAVGELADEHLEETEAGLSGLRRLQHASLVVAVTGFAVGFVLVLALAVFLHENRRRLAEQSLLHEHAATHDPLTGMPNRALFAGRLEAALEEGARSGHPAGLLVMDLNGFKDVNDTLGHQAGDALLEQVAQRLVGVCREEDTVARMGGDEFAVVVVDAPDVATVDAIAERFSAALRAPFAVAGTEVHMRASLGVAMQGRDGAGPEDLLRNADAAMYAAKRSGGIEHPARVDTDLDTARRDETAGAARVR